MTPFFMCTGEDDTAGSGSGSASEGGSEGGNTTTYGKHALHSIVHWLVLTLSLLLWCHRSGEHRG